MHKLTHGKVSSLCFGHNLVCQIFVGKSKGTAEGVFDEVFGEAPGEIGSASGYDIAQLEVVSECRAFMECAGRIDFVFVPSLAFDQAPLSGGVKILESESDRVDLAMAARALRFLHVGGELFSLGERFVGKARELRHVWWRGWRRIVQDMAKHPDAPFDGAAFNPVAAHGMNRSHTQQTTAW